MSIELIAEVSSNHGGSIPLAKEFIWRCAEAGADWVKFQTTRVTHLRPDDPQYAWFQQAELSDDAHHELKAECERAGVKCLTTVYHYADVPFVASLGLEAIKIGSGEAQDPRLASAVMATPITAVLVSLGLCGNAPTASAFGVDQWWGRTRFLAAVSRYPAPLGLAALVFRDQPQAVTWGYPLLAGWSDHAVGLSECHAAIVSGASIIEKHVQLPNQARPPKPFEATMDELKQLRAFADEDPQRFLGRWQAG